jgi:hypothetical protein
MKRLLFALSLVVVLGFGCTQKKGELSVTPVDTKAESAGVYTNAQYGFEVALPRGVEAKPRVEDDRQTEYLDLPVDFFVSIRDTVIDPKTVVNLAYVYASPDLTVDGLVAALEKSSAQVKVKTRDVINVNGVEVTKLVSTTEAGEDKTHYVFQGKDATIVMSVFLNLAENFTPIIGSLKML